MKDYSIQLLNKIKSNKYSVGIIGLGYVGLPLSLLFKEKNTKVIGFDVDLDKVRKIIKSESYINHISSESLLEATSRNFSATSKFKNIEDCDAIIICVPTPLNKNREPDLSFVHKTLAKIAPYLKKGQIISLESTTYPGTTEDIIGSFLIDRGFKVGEDFFLAYSPEREDPGNLEYNTSNIPKIISGFSVVCLEIAEALYSNISNSLYKVSDTKTAELTKLLENIYRSVNIGLVNEMKILSLEMGIDIFEVIDAASSKPFGFHPHYPGPGIGGHCIPIDPFYLTWKAREYGLNTKFIELAGEINKNMPVFVLNNLIKALNEKGKPLKNSKILILGLAYKKNVDDQRESPSIDLMSLIEKNGAVVSYSDPHIPKFKKMRNFEFNLSSEELNSETLSTYDAVIVCTDHDQFDYEMIIQNTDILLDTRGVYKRGKFANQHYPNLYLS